VKPVWTEVARCTSGQLLAGLDEVPPEDGASSSDCGAAVDASLVVFVILHKLRAGWPAVVAAGT
jgi:hypothetical protein